MPAAQAQTPYVPVVKHYGDFLVTQDRHETRVTLSFRQQGYWPGGAREVVEVRPLTAPREGQPTLLFAVPYPIAKVEMATASSRVFGQHMGQHMSERIGEQC